MNALKQYLPGLPIYLALLAGCIALVIIYFRIRKFNHGLANICAVMFSGLTVMWIACPGFVMGVITFLCVFAGFVYYEILKAGNESDEVDRIA